MPNTRFPGYNIQKGSSVSNTNAFLKYVTDNRGSDDLDHIHRESTTLFTELVSAGYNASVSGKRSFPYLDQNQPITINVSTSASRPGFNSGSVTLRAKKGFLKGSAEVKASTSTPTALDHFLSIILVS